MGNKMTPEQYLQLVDAKRPGLLSGGYNPPAMPGVTPQQRQMLQNQPQAPVRPRAQGILGGIMGALQGAGKAIYGDDDITRLRRQNAFQAMTLNPNQALITSNAAQIQRLQDQELLMEMGRAGASQITDPRLKALVEQGVISVKDALTIQYRNPTQFQQMMDLYERDPEAFENYAKSGMFGAPVGQGPYATAAAGSMDEAFSNLAANATASRGMINQLQNFTRAVGDMMTGPGTKTIGKLSEFAAQFGLPVNTEMLSQFQTIEAAAGAMVAEQLRLNKGPQTDFDARFQATIMPGLGTTNEANEQINKYLTSKSQVDVSLANVANANRTYDFDRDKAVIQEVQNYSANIPAAIDDKTGRNWEYFSDFRIKYMAENRGASDQDVIEAWLQKAREAQGIDRPTMPEPASPPAGGTINADNLLQLIQNELNRRNQVGP